MWCQVWVRISAFPIREHRNLAVEFSHVTRRLLHFSALVIVFLKRMFSSILLHENSEEIRVHLAAKQDDR